MTSSWSRFGITVEMTDEDYQAALVYVKHTYATKRSLKHLRSKTRPLCRNFDKIKSCILVYMYTHIWYVYYQIERRVISLHYWQCSSWKKFSLQTINQRDTSDENLTRWLLQMKHRFNTEIRRALNYRYVLSHRRHWSKQLREMKCLKWIFI